MSVRVSTLMRSLSRRNPVKVLSLSTNPAEPSTPHTHTYLCIEQTQSEWALLSDLHANFFAATPDFRLAYIFSITPRPDTFYSYTLEKRGGYYEVVWKVCEAESSESSRRYKYTFVF